MRYKTEFSNTQGFFLATKRINHHYLTVCNDRIQDLLKINMYVAQSIWIYDEKLIFIARMLTKGQPEKAEGFFL